MRAVCITSSHSVISQKRPLLKDSFLQQDNLQSSLNADVLLMFCKNQTKCEQAAILLRTVQSRPVQSRALSPLRRATFQSQVSHGDQSSLHGAHVSRRTGQKSPKKTQISNRKCQINLKCWRDQTPVPALFKKVPVGRQRRIQKSVTDPELSK